MEDDGSRTVQLSETGEEPVDQPQGNLTDGSVVHDELHSGTVEPAAPETQPKQEVTSESQQIHEENTQEPVAQVEVAQEEATPDLVAQEEEPTLGKRVPLGEQRESPPQRLLEVDLPATVSAEGQGADRSRDSPVANKLPPNPAPSVAVIDGRTADGSSCTATPTGEGIGQVATSTIIEEEATIVNPVANSETEQDAAASQSQLVKETFGDIEQVPVEHRLQFCTGSDVFKRNQDIKETFGDINDVPAEDRLQFCTAKEVLQQQKVIKETFGDIVDVPPEHRLEFVTGLAVAQAVSANTAPSNRNIEEIVTDCLLNVDKQKELIQQEIHARLENSLNEPLNLASAVPEEQGEELIEEGLIAFTDLLEEVEGQQNNSRGEETQPTAEQLNSAVVVEAAESVTEISANLAVARGEENVESVVLEPANTEAVAVAEELAELSQLGEQAQQQSAIVEERETPAPRVATQPNEVPVVQLVEQSEHSVQREQSQHLEAEEQPVVLGVPTGTGTPSFSQPEGVLAAAAQSLPLSVQQEIEMLKSSISKLLYLAPSAGRKPMSLNEKLILKSLLDKYTKTDEAVRRDREERWKRSCTLLAAGKDQIAKVLTEMLQDTPAN